jgi:hypothetical protein
MEVRGGDALGSPGPARAGATTHEVLRFVGSTYVTVTSVGPGRRLAYAAAAMVRLSVDTGASSRRRRAGRGSSRASR